MKVARTLAPTAAPLSALDLIAALITAAIPERSRRRLEGELREFFASESVYLFSSGRAGLTILLQALATLRAGRGVAIPAYTCFSVPAAIVRAGLDPVLVDVDPLTLDFDDDSLRRVLDRKDLLCVLPTHLFGVVADVDRVRSRCLDGEFVIEDAAQAFGVMGPNGRPLGALGDAAVFSLGRGKHLTCGHGGIVVVHTAAVAAACRRLHDGLEPVGTLGSIRLWIEMALTSVLVDPRLYWLPAALPFLGLGLSDYSTRYPIADLSRVGVGALRYWRTRLASANTAREATVEALGRALQGSEQTWRGPLLRYPLLLASSEDRGNFVAESNRRGIGVSAMYPTAIHQIPALRQRFSGRTYPGAERLARQLATAPTHQFVRPDDVARLQEIYSAVTDQSASDREALTAC